MSNLLPLTNLKELFDLVFVTGAVYLVLFFIKQSRSYVLAYSAGFFASLIFLIQVLQLTVARQLLQIFGPLLLFVFVVVFQRELRHFFDWIFISTRRLASPRGPILSKDISFLLVKAIQEMANKKIGALIVFPGELPLDGIIEGGFVLDGRVSLPILLSVFDPASPGHDGAIIIDNNRLKKFGVHLPLAENYSSVAIGTRHRAAIGLTEKSDALVVVVSEERGEISVAEQGRLERVAEMHVLEERLSQFMSQSQKTDSLRFARVFWVQNWRLKILALLISLLLFGLFYS